MTDKLGSSWSYHCAAAAWRRPESSGTADFHTGAPEYAGENYKVRGLGSVRLALYFY